MRYVHDAVNQLESVVNLRTGATWIGIEPKANRGNYWYQGKLTRNAITVETWREKYYEEEGLSDGSSAATAASSSSSGAQSASVIEPFCKSDDEIREYLNDKVVVVYVAQSYVAQEDQEPNNNELITSLTPIVEKRLDFRLHKYVNALI